VTEDRTLLFHRRQEPPPAMYFFAVMAAGREYQAEAEARIQKEFGPLNRRSPLFSFSEFSPYYAREMGSDIGKYFVALREAMPMDRLREVKLFAEKLEVDMSKINDSILAAQTPGTVRSVNLDPGYVTGWSVVLSTVKNRAHRVYLGEGIFAEVTLLYQKGGYSRLPWTYPDYDTPLATEFFRQVRSSLLDNLR
jgi:hypothetical protein